MTTDNNLLEESGPDVTEQTFDEQVEDISNLLDDPATDPIEDDKKESAAEETIEEDDDPLGLNEAEDVADENAEDPDGSDDTEIKGGRFAPDTAKVTLDDGSVLTVSELKRGHLYQRGFTEKTTALSEERKTFEAERTQITEQAQSLGEFRDYAAWYSENYLPKAPAPFEGNPQEDPMGYLQWTQNRDAYNTHADAFQKFQQFSADQEKSKSGETQKLADVSLAHERDALLKAMPILADGKKGRVAWDTIVSGAEHYGINEQEVNTVGDHRMVLVLRDAIAYRRLKANAPLVRDKVAQKPPVTPGRRANRQTADSKGIKARSDALRNSGSLQDGIAVLSDFDL